MKNLLAWVIRVLKLEKDPIINTEIYSDGMYGYTAIDMSRNQVLLNSEIADFETAAVFYSKDEIFRYCQKANIDLENVYIFPNGYLQKIVPVVTVKSVAVNKRQTIRDRNYYDD